MKTLARTLRPLLVAAPALAALLSLGEARAVTRDEVITRARAFAYHPWVCGSANLTASCNTSYKSLYVTGAHVGVAYDWGGYMSLSTFDQQIAAGYGAGSLESDGILACTSGLDCSGFVSQAWQTTHNTTSSIPQITGSVQSSAMLAGDVFNMAGYHVAMYTSTLASGAPAMVEALGYNVHVNTYGGWSHVSGYTPRRFNSITGAAANVPLGTPTTPIPVTSFPFTDQRNTTQSTSRMFDRCPVAPSIDQSGPEYVYAVTITQPGTLTLAVSDDASADIDLQLLEALAPAGCVARHDSTISRTVGCGTYYVVADTFGSSAGAYTLTATFAPSGQSCGAVAGPPVRSPLGKLGDACRFPGNQSLPLCNANLGGEACIYTQTTSFCSKACAVDADCNDLPGGGCCRDLGQGELYCVTAPLCGAADAGITKAGDAGPGGGGGGPDPSGPGGEGQGGGAGDGTPGGGSGAAPGPQTITTTSGCETTPRSSSDAPVLVVPLVALGLTLARRRRRSPVGPQ
jgi:MYXO-CTERM domain-containing protein